MTIAERVNQLAQSGLGLSAQDIASIIDVDAAEVVAYMRDNSHTITPPSGGGGAAIKTALVWGPSLAATAGSGVPLADADIFDDDIGISIAAEGPYILLPKGYYQANLSCSVGGLESDSPITPTDELTVTAWLSATGYHAGGPVPAAPGFGGLAAYNSISGTAAHLDTSPTIGSLSATIGFESGDEDISNLGLVEHDFAMIATVISVRNHTTSTDYTDSLAVTNFQVYIQKLGDKA